VNNSTLVVKEVDRFNYLFEDQSDHGLIVHVSPLFKNTQDISELAML
jgi:hypothetical protein